VVQDAGWAGGQHRMARPYSQDLRDRVVSSVASGRTCRATAALFGVSVASVVNGRSAGARAAAQQPSRWAGWRQLRLQRERAWLLARIVEKPDLTLRAVVAELAERGTPASYGAVWRFFKHEGITFKKTRHASEQDRVDIARRRTRWKAHQGRLDPKRLVFIDETPAFAGQALGQDQHEPPASVLPSRRSPGRQGAASPLAHLDLSGGTAPRPHHRALRHRRADQRHRLWRPMSSSFWFPL
jgi:transposase